MQNGVLQWLMLHRDQVDALVFDIDGVLMAAGRPRPGSQELLAWLRQQEIPFQLLTNDASHSPVEKTAALAACGLQFHSAELVSASHGIAELAERQRWRGQLFFLMGELGKPCYAESAGLQVTRDLQRIDAAHGIIVGEEDYDWQAVIGAVFNYLMTHPAAPLIVPNPDEYFPGQQGGLEVASGAIARFLCQLCQTRGIRIEPFYLGKPYGPIFAHNHAMLEKRCRRPLRRDRVFMVGDSLASDILGGNQFGYQTVLVLGGITEPAMLAASSIQPVWMAPSL